MQFSEQHLIRSIREANTTAGITQCHAATHTWPLSSPGLSRNRDKQHEICADSALHSPGLLQDRTQGWLVSLRLSPVSNKVKETTDIPCPNCEEPGKRGVTSLLGTCVSCCDHLLICCYWLTHPYQVSYASKLSRGGQVSGPGKVPQMGVPSASDTITAL